MALLRSSANMLPRCGPAISSSALPTAPTVGAQFTLLAVTTLSMSNGAICRRKGQEVTAQEGTASRHLGQCLLPYLLAQDQQ